MAVLKSKKLILKAKKAGADAVKFQNFKSERLIVTDNAPMARYQIMLKVKILNLIC